jgi:hypothetical protein
MYPKGELLDCKKQKKLKRKIATLEVHPSNMKKKTRSGIESSSATRPPCAPPLVSKTSTIAQLVKC